MIPQFCIIPQNAQKVNESKKHPRFPQQKAGMDGKCLRFFEQDYCCRPKTLASVSGVCSSRTTSLGRQMIMLASTRLPMFSSDTVP